MIYLKILLPFGLAGAIRTTIVVRWSAAPFIRSPCTVFYAAMVLVPKDHFLGWPTPTHTSNTTNRINTAGSVPPWWYSMPLAAGMEPTRVLLGRHCDGGCLCAMVMCACLLLLSNRLLLSWCHCVRWCFFSCCRRNVLSVLTMGFGDDHWIIVIWNLADIDCGGWSGYGGLDTAKTTVIAVVLSCRLIYDVLGKESFTSILG